MKAKIVDKRQEAVNTKTFFLETQKKFVYLPGQYIYCTLAKLNFPDTKGPTRHFTISSSPTEGPLIRFTTLIRPESGFKKSLDSLSMGSLIEIDGPNGSFILDENEEGPHIFIAGGIGITPFRSMINYVLDKNLSYKIHLLYSVSTIADFIFKNELEHYSDLNPNIKISSTITSPDESKQKWLGQTGRIDAAFIGKIAQAYSNPTYWVCGSLAFRDATLLTLKALKVAKSQINSEDFTGY